MKRNIKSLTGFTLGAVDGEIGKVKEFYFDDNSWTIRYLVVETGNWLSGRTVLISPDAFLAPDFENEVFNVNLTQEAIKHSPDIDTEQPVSRQEEIKLNAYYPWKRYWEGSLWGGGMGTTGMVVPTVLPFDEAPGNEPEPENVTEALSHADHHLRSTRKTLGYNIKATDGDIGDIEDFIIDDASWKIEFIVVDTGNWLPGKKVLISPQWIREIDWLMSTVAVNATVESVKKSPEYHPDHLISDEYADQLHQHYNAPLYANRP